MEIENGHSSFIRYIVVFAIVMNMATCALMYLCDTDSIIKSVFPFLFIAVIDIITILLVYLFYKNQYFSYERDLAQATVKERNELNKKMAELDKKYDQQSIKLRNNFTNKFKEKEKELKEKEKELDSLRNQLYESERKYTIFLLINNTIAQKSKMKAKSMHGL